MFPLIAAAAKVLLPMVGNLFGGLMSGGLGGFLSKIMNFGDLLGGAMGKAQERTQDAKAKMAKADEKVQTARMEADAFYSRVSVSAQFQAMPMPATNLV